MSFCVCVEHVCMLVLLTGRGKEGGRERVGEERVCVCLLLAFSDHILLHGWGWPQTCDVISCISLLSIRCLPRQVDSYSNLPTETLGSMSPCCKDSSDRFRESDQRYIHCFSGLLPGCLPGSLVRTEVLLGHTDQELVPVPLFFWVIPSRGI